MGINRPLGRTDRVRGWRLGISLCAAALVMALSAGSAAAAGGVYCVGPDSEDLCPVGSTTESTLTAVLNDGSNPLSPSSLNTIYLTAGASAEPAPVDFALIPVKLVGLGSVKPTVSVSAPVASGAAITSVNQSSEFSGFNISVSSSTGFTGLRTDGGQKITNVGVSGTSAPGSTGFHISGGNPKLRGATVDIEGTDSLGVYIEGSTGARVTDLVVSRADTALDAYDAVDLQVQRMVSHARRGIHLERSSGTISSSLIVPSPVVSEHSAYGIIAESAADVDRSVRIDNCTIIGTEGWGTGVTASSSDAGTTMDVSVNSSIIAQFQTAIWEDSGDGSTANLSLKASRFNGMVAGDPTIVGPSTEYFDFGFVDADNGDYRLALISPLIDAGDTDAPDSTDSPNDVAGNPRVVSRGAGNIRDIGAYEVQNNAPIPSIKIVTAVPSTTVPTEFSAASSTDAEGDTLTYDWSFDGAPATSGVTLKKLFPADGPHTVQLTVTDKAGASATTSQQFTVARGFLPVKLRSQNARLTTKGTFKITLSCPAEAISNCSGRLLFQTAKKVNAKNYPNRPGWISKTSYLQAARYVFSIAPGTTKKLEVRTYSTFQNILAVKKKFKLVGSLVSGTTNNANLTANRATFTISAPKPRKK